MRATSGQLLLPSNARWRLLDAGREVSGFLLLEWRHDLRARRIARGMLAARMKYAA
jgi:hypothetical protein